MYVRNTSMVVAGTKDFPRDAWDDVSKLPFQTTYNSPRSINADKALYNNDSLCPDHKITSIVGHALGRSVVLEMQQQNPDRTFTTTTYGAPVISMPTPVNINTKGLEKYGDVISVLDRGATMSVKNHMTIQNVLNID